MTWTRWLNSLLASKMPVGDILSERPDRWFGVLIGLLCSTMRHRYTLADRLKTLSRRLPFRFGALTRYGNISSQTVLR